MSWYELSVKTSEMAIDAVTNILYEIGAQGVVIVNPNDPDFLIENLGIVDYYDAQNISLDFDGVLVKAYYDKDDIEPVIETISARVNELPSFGIEVGLGEVVYVAVDPTDWENEWKKYFKPFRIGDHIVVKPTWEAFETKEDDIVIEIDPGNAFGSGTHETTSMCIEMISKYLNSDSEVIDIGCGSGILAIAAGKMGAKKIVGVDIDMTAVKTAEENVENNKLEAITDIRHGDLLDVITEKADLVVANIMADIVMFLSESVREVMKDDGVFIASGIILAKVDEVVEKLDEECFEVIEIMRKGEWAVIVSKKR